MAAAIDPARGALGIFITVVLLSRHSRVTVVARPDKETRERFYGSLVLGSFRNSSGDGSIADMFDRVLEKEFSDSDAPDGPDTNSFNNSVADHQVVGPQKQIKTNARCLLFPFLKPKLTKALSLSVDTEDLPRGFCSKPVCVTICTLTKSDRVALVSLCHNYWKPVSHLKKMAGLLLFPTFFFLLLDILFKIAVLETVAIITHDKAKKNDTMETNATKPFQIQDVFSLENEGSDDTTTLIDRKDNVFVMSNRKSKYPVLQVDLRLISDLVVVIVSATVGGIVFSCLGQPVIVGYLLAGSFIGPGGLNFISEMVQVETVAQFGVVFLLFALGLEFSLPKLKAVGAVAVLGGLLQIAILMFLGGVTSMLCSAKLSEGIFVGSFLSMSSTAVVSKFLIGRSSTSSLHGQVTIGTLILQDCAVGLLFALLPVLGGNSGVFQGIISIAKSLLVLSMFIASASILSWSIVPRFLKLMIQLSSQTNELYQLASVAFCLFLAWCSDKLGLSLELGAFVAGVMVSTTDFAQHTLDQVEAIRNLFAALFLASIGMLIHVQFLWNHVDILLASVILVVIVKTVVVTTVTKAFGYSIRTSFIVGLSLAQIGEFAFVLLSRASNLHLVEGKMYLLLLGTTALSLVTTPLMFKIIPAVMHLGNLMRWFPTESNIQSEDKATVLEVYNRAL